MTKPVTKLNLFDTAGVREVGADGAAIEAEGRIQDESEP